MTALPPPPRSATVMPPSFAIFPIITHPKIDGGVYHHASINFKIPQVTSTLN